MRIIVKILKWLGIGLGTLLVLGFLYQTIGSALDAHFAPPPSDIVNVNGRAVHLACEGKGPETILLDAGAGAGVFEWFRVQPALAKSARVCAFDRAGLGWSDAMSGGYDAIAAADQLSELVKAAKIPAPFVYIGHSLGANFGMVYAARHPHDVSALVLIEPGVPVDLLEDYHGTRADAFKANDCDISCYAAGAATMFGVVRAASLLIGHKTFDEPHRATYQAFLARPSTTMTLVASLNATIKTAYEVEDVHGFGNIPVLTIGSSDPLQGGELGTVPDYAKWKARQRGWFAQVARMSRRGQGPLIVPDSTHTSMTVGEKQSAWLTATIQKFLATVH